MAGHAMHPQEALQTIAAVRHGRELLTARAVGQIWMVWGLVIGLIGLASQSAFHAAFPGGWIDPVFILVGGSIGAVITIAVWRAHAIGPDIGHARWVPWAFGVGGLMVLGVLIVLSNRIELGSRMASLAMAPLSLAGAYGAAAVAFATRHHVSALPGAAATALLLAAFTVARFVPLGDLPADDFLGNLALNALNIAAFTLVGWIHFRRG